MGLRIERIKIDRDGPLRSDFDLSCRDLNLIYGPNETGKTYLVEALINFLFREKGRHDWDRNRKWDFGGRVVISGLNDDGDRIPFPNEIGEKLEDYWESKRSITPHFSRLVVVRAGETTLNTGEADGVGRDLLKDCLSGEGLLDGIQDKIQLTVQKAVIENRVITGNQTGELRDRPQAETRVRKSKDLLERVEEAYTSGKAFSWREKIEQLRLQFEDFEKAKRYRAGQLQGEIERLREGKQALPSESELAVLSSDVEKCRTDERQIKTKSGNLKDLASTKKNYRWSENAIEVYEKAKSDLAMYRPNQTILLFAAILVAASIIAAVLSGFEWWWVICILGVLLVGKEMWNRQQATSSGWESSELEGVKTEFRTRFGSDLTEIAELKAKRQELNDDLVRGQSLKDNLDERTEVTRTEKQRIGGILTGWKNNEVKFEDWDDVIRSLTDQAKGLSKEIESRKSALASLHVMEEDHLDEDPGVEWDREFSDKLEQMINDTKRELKEEEARLHDLKLEVVIETTQEDVGWEKLIAALRKKYERAVQEYQIITAKILAGHLVTGVIGEFRQDEDRSIVEGLNSEEVTKPLHLLTGRYREIRLSPEKDLVLVSDDDDLYPLSELSTGVREQIFLALRMGFASRAMGGETGFLILDDAFQHSDWSRREKLVSQILSLVQSGWQVFYFTMDDHIRGLFQKIGSEMGDGFAERGLG